MPKICLYAEVLTHIRQLTLHASLKTDGDETPQIDISSDKKVITVTHEGESSSLFLPTQISGTANVTFLTPSKTELTARVQIDDLVEWQEFGQNGIEAPWDATELSPTTCVQCRRCRSNLLRPGSITQWKDLPNQDWADIMDLWYCHKPHEQHDDEEQKRAAEAKGYSEKSKLASVQGVGMVDVVSFVLHPSDCVGIEFPDRVNENDLKPQSISCSTCKIAIGVFSFSDNLVKLYKSNVAVQRTTNDEFTSFPASTFICAQLLSLVESSPIRKVVVHTTGDINELDSEEEKTPAASRDQNLHSKTDFNLSRKPNANPGGPSESESTDDTTQLYSRTLTSDSISNAHAQQTEPSPTRSRSLNATVEDESNEFAHNQNHTEINHQETNSRKETTQILNSSIPEIVNNNRSQDTGCNNDMETDSHTKPKEPPRGLLLWIFNPDIYYSSSLRTTTPSNPTTHAATSSSSNPAPAPTPTSTSTPQPIQGHAHRAMKIFYQPLANPEKYLETTPATQIEDLQLPTQSDLHSLHTTLLNSTSILPQSARTFQDWNVGLLDRYEKRGSADDVMGQNPLCRRTEGDARVTRWELPAGHQELYL